MPLRNRPGEELGEIERSGGIVLCERGNPDHRSVGLCHPDVTGGDFLGV
jgi:hypothetical protein